MPNDGPDGVRQAKQDQMVAKALEEFFAGRAEQAWTTEDLHYHKLEQEELNDPPGAPAEYPELKAFLIERNLWFPA